MPYKVCTACHQTSYTAAGDNIWICPCCGEDISSSASIKQQRDILTLRHNQPKQMASPELGIWPLAQQVK